MQLSRKDMFCNALASTDQAALDSTDTLDWIADSGNDIDGELRWFVLNTRAATSAGAATLTITWQTSSDNSNWTTVYTSATFTLAQCAVAGSYLVNGLVLPTGLKRYNKLVFTSAGANWTIAPLLTAGVVKNDMVVE